MLKQLCFVLRAVNYRDSDKILTLFSRSEGKITAQARGVRNIKNALAPATQPFCCAEYEFYQKKERLFLTNAHIREEFFAVQSDYELYTAGCVMLELSEKILEHTTKNDDLFVLLSYTLYAMEKKQLSAKVALAYFLVQCIYMLGIFPALSFCTHCGVEVNELVHWSALQGGAVCSQCAQVVRKRRVNDGTKAFFEVMLRAQPNHFKQLEELPVDFAYYIALLNEYLGLAGDIQLKTMKYFIFDEK